MKTPRHRVPSRPVSGPRRRPRRRPSLERLEERSLLSLTITVNTTTDTYDPNDGVLSLREAIAISDGLLPLSSLGTTDRAQVLVLPSPPSGGGGPPPPNTILFDLPVGSIQTISVVGQPLPAITAPVIIDGYSQAGSSVSSPDKTEVILNDARVRIDGTALGAGTPGVGYDGLSVVTSNCEINGLIVTGFSGVGISISGLGSQGNWLWGNFFGALPDPSGGRIFAAAPAGLSNQIAGVRVTSSNNRIGGNTPGLPNVIANNGYDPLTGASAGGVGLLIDTPGGTGNLIQGNGVFNNAAQGVLVRSSNNTIGEALQGGGNVIGGNGADGILITGDATVQGNGVFGNFIGTDLGTADGKFLKGTLRYANQGNGILIQGSPKNVIGGSATAARNVIGTNLLDGVAITGQTATGNRLLNNWIGFNIANGAEYLLPNRNGVSVFSPNNVIGDPLGGLGNTIANNRQHGVLLTGADASGNTIAGNVVGLNPDGGSAFPNAFDGVHLDNAPNNLIGGVTPRSRNTISSNNNGVYLDGPGSTGNLIQGNFIGTGVDGLTDLGNAVDGVVISNAPNNTVGGTAAGAGNVISGNNRGIRITGSGSTRNDVQGNFIGTDLTGQAVIPNEIDGILITGVASNNLIGDPLPGAGNTITHNAGAGVYLDSGTANSVLNNSIAFNNALGIVLNPATNANLGQRAPSLLAVTPNGATTNVQGTLVAAALTTYTLQFFSSTAKDPSGFGQGQTYLFTTTVTTDGSGRAVFSIDLPNVVDSGQFVTATATDLAGNTSAFSNALPAVPVGFKLGSATYTVNESDGVATISVTRTGGQGGSVAVSYTIGGGTATPGVDYTPVSGTLFFNPGDPATKTFVIPILDPHKVGGSVTLNVTLTDPTNGATLGTPSTAVLTILDNDQPSVQFGPTPGPVTGSGVVTFTVVRDSGAGTMTVDYATVNGSALAWFNYTPVSGTLTFGPGETRKTVTVPVLNDFQFHPAPLTFSLVLSRATGGALGPARTSVGTIIPVNNPGTFQLAATKIQAAPGATSATFTVYRNVGKTGTASVVFTTGGGTARPWYDYTPMTGTLTFGPGEYSKTVTVPLIGTGSPGADVTFDLMLSNPGGGAKLGKPDVTTATITHPPAPPVPPNPADLLPPTVTGIQPVSGPQGIYAVVVSFSKAMDPFRVQNTVNYGFYLTNPRFGGLYGRANDLSVGIAAAVYDPISRRAVLFLGAPVPRGAFGRLVISQGGGTAPGLGLTDVFGKLLDGTGTGWFPGIPYTTIVR